MDLLKKRKLEEHGSPPEPLSHDDLRKAIKPFTHQQLSEIVATASLRHADVLEAVRSIANQDIGNRRLSITGLSNETTSQKLRQIFAAYGDLEIFRTYVRTIPTFTGSGYVTYKHIDDALRALKKRHKLIDGKMTVTQLASTAVVDQIPVKASTKGDSSVVAAPAAATTAKGGAVKPEVVNLNGGNVGQGPSVRHSQPLHSNSAATTAKVKVQGSSGAFKPEVVNRNKKSSTSFGGGGANGVYDYGANVGGLGSGKFGYGGVGQGPFVRHSQPNLNSSKLPSYGINGNTAPVSSVSTTTAIQVASDRMKREVVNTNQHGSFASQFGGSGPSSVSAYSGHSSGLRLPQGPSSVSEYSSDSDYDSDFGGLGLPGGPSSVSEYSGNYGGLGLLHGLATTTEVHVPRSADMVKRELELVAREVNVPRSGGRVKREVKLEMVVDTEVPVLGSDDRVKREIEVHVPRSGDRVKLEVKRKVKREVVNSNQQNKAMVDMRMSSGGYYSLSSNLNQQSSTSFGGGGANGVYDYGANVGGLGSGKFGYGGVGQGPLVRHSQPNLNSSRLPSYGINGNTTLALSVSTTTAIQGSSDRVRRKVVNTNQQGSFASQFGGSGSSSDSDSSGLGLPRGPSSVSAFNGNSGGLGLLHRPATSTEVHVPRSADMVKRELELVAKEDNVPRSGGRVKREVKLVAEVHVQRALVDAEVHGPGSSGDRVKREVKQDVGSDSVFT